MVRKLAAFALLLCFALLCFAGGCGSQGEDNTQGTVVNSADLKKHDESMRGGKGPGVPSDTVGKPASGPGGGPTGPKR